MKDFLLSLGLDEKVTSQILEKHRAEVETLHSSNTELNKALELSKQETDARDKQLKELAKIDVDGLQEKIKSFEAENKELINRHSEEIANLKTDFAIDKALTSHGARNHRAVLPFLNKDGLKLNEDGTLSGLNEQIKSLIESEDTSFLFNTKDSGEVSPIVGLSAVASAEQTSTVNKDIKEMNYLELCDYYENGGI